MIERLRQIMHAEIPLSRHIGIQPQDFSGSSLTLTAPLSDNLNHKNTAFGGSLYSVCVLSGWGLLYVTLEQQGFDGQIVIQQSKTRFLSPVNKDISASCSFESQDQCSRFLKMYKRKGVARIHLQSRIICDSRLCVDFQGSYVVQK